MFSISQQSVRIVKERIIPYAEQLNCGVSVLSNGATVVDMGVHAPGGWLAGKLFVEASLGGLGYVDFGTFHGDDFTLPAIEVYIDQPLTACLSSQFAGWRMPAKGGAGHIQAMGSGPARAVARNDPYARAWTYHDHHHETVFALQATDPELPTESLAEEVAEVCKIDPKNVYILVARTGSLVGSIQVGSRTVEASIWRLKRKGFDIARILHAMGTCPVAPPVWDEVTAMNRVNTALLYCSTVRYTVDCPDEQVAAVVEDLPFTASRRYGEPFSRLFEEGGRDLLRIDKDALTMARFEITNIATGNTWCAGEIRDDMLKATLLTSDYQRGVAGV